MRFVLRQGTREVLVFSRNRLAQFDDAHGAGRFLAHQLQDSRDNLARLRQAVADAPALQHLADADHEVLVSKVATLLAEGGLALLLDPDALAPWSWPFALTASVPQFDAGADGEGEPLAAQDDEGEIEDPELEEVKPEPVIPPVYPQVAQAEASALLFETRLFSIALDLLRWIGANVPGASEVAELMTQIGQGSGNALREAVGGAAAILLQLLGDRALVGDTEVGGATRAVADVAGRAVHSAAAAGFARLLGLAGPNDFGPTDTGVGGVFRGLVGEQRGALDRGVDNTMADLRRLLGTADSADYDFGAAEMAGALPEIDEDGYDEAALLDAPVWLEQSWTGLPDSPEEPAAQTCIGREVVARVKAVDLPIGTMVRFTVHDALGRTLAEGETVGGTGGPQGATTLRWRPGTDLRAPAGGDSVQVYFKARAEGDAGDVQSPVIEVRLDRAEDPTGAAMLEPSWAMAQEDVFEGDDPEAAVEVARFDHTVRLRVNLEGFTPGDAIRFEVNRLTGHELEEVATVTAEVSAADGVLEATLPLPNLEGMSALRPWHDLVFRAFADDRALMIQSPVLRTVPPYHYTDNVDEPVTLTLSPWLRHAEWVDGEGRATRSFAFDAPSVPLRLSVEALRVEGGTPARFIVYSAADDAELARLDGSVEDGVSVVAWVLRQQPGLEAGLYFEVEVEDTNGPIRSPVIKARPAFGFSDNAGETEAALPDPRFDWLRWTDGAGEAVASFAADLAPQTLQLAARPVFVPADGQVVFTIHRLDNDLELASLTAPLAVGPSSAAWALEEALPAGTGLYFTAFADGMAAPVRGPTLFARARFSFSDNLGGVVVPIPTPPTPEGALSGPQWQRAGGGLRLESARQGVETPVRLWVRAGGISPGKPVVFTVSRRADGVRLQQLTTRVRPELDGLAWVDWEIPPHAEGSLVFEAQVSDLPPITSDPLPLIASFGFSDNPG